VSIHAEHPFLTPQPFRDPVRRARGRLNAPVSVWASGAGAERAGLTVSSMIIAEGDPGEVIGLVNPDSALGVMLGDAETLAVSILGEKQRQVADVFAGATPSPGGKFRTGSWTQTEWGPVLDGVPGWIGARLVGDEPLRAGYSLVIRAVIEKIELAPLREGERALGYLRGSYHFPAW
jgi:flavin reductase (DIM6/NTAB) family NADH-FMN oxidoreductase RutF